MNSTNVQRKRSSFDSVGYKRLPADRLCVGDHLSHGRSVMGSNRNLKWLTALQQHRFPSLLSSGPLSLSSRYSRSNGLLVPQTYWPFSSPCYCSGTTVRASERDRGKMHEKIYAAAEAYLSKSVASYRNQETNNISIQDFEETKYLKHC